MLCDNLEWCDGWEVGESFRRERTYVSMRDLITVYDLLCVVGFGLLEFF